MRAKIVLKPVSEIKEGMILVLTHDLHDQLKSPCVVDARIQQIFHEHHTLINYAFQMWGVSEKPVSRHAGISKKGTGPGVTFQPYQAPEFENWYMDNVNIVEKIMREDLVGEELEGDIKFDASWTNIKFSKMTPDEKLRCGVFTPIFPQLLKTGDHGSVGEELLMGVPELELSFKAAVQSVVGGYMNIQEAYETFIKEYE